MDRVAKNLVHGPADDFADRRGLGRTTGNTYQTICGQAILKMDGGGENPFGGYAQAFHASSYCPLLWGRNRPQLAAGIGEGVGETQHLGQKAPADHPRRKTLRRLFRPAVRRRRAYWYP